MEDNEEPDGLLETGTAFICTLCMKVFEVKNYRYRADARKTAKRHSKTHTENAAVLNYSVVQGENLLHASSALEAVAVAEESTYIQASGTVHPESCPSALFGLMYLRFGFSEREADAVLRLLKLNLDFTKVKTAKDVMQSVGVATASERAACRTCERQGTVEKNSYTCAFDCNDEHVEKYITGDLAQQLLNICDGEDLFNYTPGKFRELGTICDITDGKAYQRNQETFRAEHNVAADEIVLTLILSTDGVKIFESSAQSLWPVFATVCELPTNKRFLNEKVVNYALWQGVGKPPLSCIMPNLMEEVEAINENGLFINCCAGRKRIYVTVPAITGDLQARAFYLNMVGVGGEHCCAICEAKGLRVPKGGGTCRIFPHGSAAVRRTNDSVRLNAQTGTDDRPSKGFCGTPPIIGLGPRFDFGSGILIDAMHGLCLGVAKDYTTLLFAGSRYLNEEQRSKVTKRYRAFRPPPTLTRNPQHINVKQWKASDYRNWVLHFSVSCLVDIIPPEYLAHWSLLVDAYTVLNSSHIRLDDLQRAARQLDSFATDFTKLFDENEFRINLHGLSHLAEQVDLWGPLFCYDLFAFESKNGWLTRHSYAKHNVTRSLMRPLLGSQILQKRAESISMPEEQVLVRLIQGQRQTPGLSGHGWRSWSAASLMENDNALPVNHPCAFHKLKALKTAIVKGINVWTSAYKKPKRTMARYFRVLDTVLNEKSFACITGIIMCSDCMELYLVGQKMRPEFVEPNIVKLYPTDNQLIFNVRNAELQECVSLVEEDCVQVILMEKTRYSS